MKRLLSVFVFCCALSSGQAETLWTEGFEGAFPPAGWLAESIDQSPTYAFDGSYSAKFSATDDNLITRQISDAQTLIFWSYTTAADPKIIVEYAPDAAGPWTAAPKSPFSGYTEQWNGQFIDLSGLGSVHIRFRKTGSGTLYIDDVSVEDGSAASNSPPVLDPIGNREVSEQGLLSFTVTAADPDNDPVTLTATNLPSGAVFKNGVFTWSRAAPVGTYAVTFYATDKDGADSETITITVTSADTESTIAGTFTGLHYQNIYQLADGTVWRQVSFENISSSASPVTVRRWMENGRQMMRFLDRNDSIIGTCTVEMCGAPINAPIISAIDGYFRGWQNQRVFALANGQFWQQTSLDSSSQTLYRPAVTITNWLQTGSWRMSVAGLSGYVNVQRLTNVTRTAISGYFYGFGNGQIFNLADGSWWRQISPETSTFVQFNPDVLVWSNQLQLADEGLCISVDRLNVQLESTITDTFSGLHYGNLYRLANGETRLQISFENVSTNATEPRIMLWIDGAGSYLLVRDSREVTIGTCTVVDPALDADNDGVSNQREVIAGSDPLDSQSRFELRQTSRYVLSWKSVKDRVYTIEWTPSLTESFRPLANGIAWPQNSWTDMTHAVETKGYYRITVRLAE